MNAPSELDLLRRVASAAAWAIEANGDDPVGRDGRSKVGLNWIMANGALNRALRELRKFYDIAEHHADDRAYAARLTAEFSSLKRVNRKGRGADADTMSITYPPEMLPTADGPAEVVVVDPNTGDETVVYDPDATVQ